MAGPATGSRRPLARHGRNSAWRGERQAVQGRREHHGEGRGQLMSDVIRIVVVLDGGADRNAVEAVLPAASGIELLSVTEGVNNAWHEAGAEDVDAVLVASGSNP